MRDAALVGRRLDVLALGAWTLVDCEPGGLLDHETTLVDGTTLTLDSTGRASFEGFIESVDLETGTVMLMDRVRVRIGEATMIPEDAEFGHLEAVLHALEEGDTLVAWGHGRLEGEEPRVVAASKVSFMAREPAPAEFEAYVVEVDTAAGTVTLDDTTTVHVTHETDVSDTYELPPLAAVQEALDAGHHVPAWGQGEQTSDEPREITADKITFRVPSDGTSGDAVAAGRLRDAGGPGAGVAIAATESRVGHA